MFIHQAEIVNDASAAASGGVQHRIVGFGDPMGWFARMNGDAASALSWWARS
jgi:hypothetical protein